MIKGIVIAASILFVQQASAAPIACVGGGWKFVSNEDLTRGRVTFNNRGVSFGNLVCKVHRSNRDEYGDSILVCESVRRVIDAGISLRVTLDSSGKEMRGGLGETTIAGERHHNLICGVVTDFI